MPENLSDQLRANLLTQMEDLFANPNQRSLAQDYEIIRKWLQTSDGIYYQADLSERFLKLHQDFEDTLLEFSNQTGNPAKLLAVIDRYSRLNTLARRGTGRSAKIFEGDLPFAVVDPDDLPLQDEP